MEGLFGQILAKLTAIVTWIGNLFKACFDAIWNLGKDAVCWAFDSILSIVVGAVSAVDLTGLDQYTQTWSSLPASLLQVLGVLRVGEASAIIVAAIGIRLVLQLIPFTRLGS